MRRDTNIELISIILMILFLYAAASKLIEFSIFKEQIAESPILAPISKLIASLLPICEIGIVVLLLIPNWRLFGFYASLILMCAFTIYVVLIMAFDDKLPCSCGGILAQLSWPQHIVFNLFFTMLSIIGLLLERRNKKQQISTS